MFARTLLMFAVLLSVSACSTTSDESGMDETMMQQGMTEGPLSDIYGQDTQGPAPGTQADLVVNVGDRVFFGYDRYDVSEEARATLDAQAAWLQRYPNLTVTVEGHADERGTREYNLALGERRANAVKNYLVSMGVNAGRLSTISYGKERPAVPGSNETAWAQNRRGVTKVD